MRREFFWGRARYAGVAAAALLGSCVLLPDARPPGTRDQGCEQPRIAPGAYAERLSFSSGGRERVYYLHVPPGLDPTRPAPLVLNFHGLNSSPLEHLAYSELNVTADARQFLVAYPEGISASWNGGDCCGKAAEREIDDVSFARDVVQDVSSQVCVDRRRVYAAGFSNGGILAHRLACEASDTFAAVAVVAGGLFSPSCTLKRPIPILAIHGTEDQLVAFSIARSSDVRWQARDGCSRATREADRCVFHDDCLGTSEVGLCTLEGVDHCWPGQPQCPFGPSTSPLDFSANVEIWRFFRRHRLSASP